MIAQDLGCHADCHIRSERSVGPHVKRKLVVVGILTDTGILNGHVDTLDRRVDRIYRDHSDRHIVFLSLIRAHIASAVCDGQFHAELAVRSAIQSSNDLVRVYDLDILIYIDISSGHCAFAAHFDVSCLRIISRRRIADRQVLNVQDDLRYVFLYSRNTAEFMKYSVDLDLTDRRSRKGGKHNSAKRIAKGRSIASLKRLDNETAMLLIFRHLRNGNVWNNKIEQFSPSL